MGNVVSDAIGGVEYAFKKAGSLVGLTDDPDDSVQYPSGIAPNGSFGIIPGLSVSGLNYDKSLLEKPTVAPDDSTLLLAQNYQQEDDHLRRSQAIPKPAAAPKDEVNPETLMLAGGLVAAAVLLSN